MHLSDWVAVKHFTVNENWGDSSIISLDLVKELDLFREFTGIPMVITCGTQGDHVPNSQHPMGLAVDCVFRLPDGKTIWDVWIDAQRFAFKGIGVYPHWKLEGVAVGGLHLDVRKAPYRAQWIGRIDPIKGKQVYLPVSKENLLLAGFPQSR